MFMPWVSSTTMSNATVNCVAVLDLFYILLPVRIKHSQQ